MSGPIVRQYGVPNWDDIFGKKTDEQDGGKTTQDAKTEKSKDADAGSEKASEGTKANS